MAEIAFPANVKSSLVRMGGLWAQSVLRADGGARQALQLADPSWRGAVVLEVEDHVAHRQLAAWLFSMGRGDNWSAVPIGKPLTGAALSMTVISHDAPSGVMRVTTAASIARLTDTYLTDGRRLRYVQSAAAVTGQNGQKDLTVVPPAPAQQANDTMTETDTIRAQVADATKGSSASGDANFGRPVRFEWIEYTL